MTTKPASNFRIRQAAVAALGLRGLAAQELAAKLEAAGIDLGPAGVDRLDELLESSSEFIDLEDRWLGVAATLDGTRWITTVDAGCAESNVLAAEPDLGLIGWWGLDIPLTLGDSGEPVVADATLAEGSYLEGPAGWLDSYVGRDIEVKVQGTQLHLSVVQAPPVVSPAMAEAVRAAFEQHAYFDDLFEVALDGLEFPQIALDTLMWESLVAHREVFVAEPIPPADLLITAAGLVRDDRAIFRDGVDRDALHRWRSRAQLALNHDLEGEQVDAAEAVIKASFGAMSNMPEVRSSLEAAPGAAGSFARALADLGVCTAVLDSHVSIETPPLKLAEFARAIAAELPDGEGAGPRWLEGRALDLGGDPEGSISAFEAAVATGEEHPLALIGLAGFRADAGDALEALALLHRTGIDREREKDEADDPGDDAARDLVNEVSEFAQRPPPQAGRNAPCPCGSGRKYKSCHLGQERHALIERGVWLYAKEHRFARSHEDWLVYALAVEMNGASRGTAPLEDLLELKLVSDIALREGGVGESFVAARDAILPDDEALLAARWELVERSLFEVEEATNVSVSLRDLRSGDRITVTNTNRQSRSHRGDLMLGRPLPVGDTWRAYSGLVKVGPRIRDEVLEALDRHDPFEIANIVGRCFAPPEMQNTDGDPLELHELIWRLPDPEAARHALDAHDALTESNGRYDLIRDTAGQAQTVILSLIIEGDELLGDVNSERRADEVITLVETLLPDAEMVDHDLRDINEITHTPRDPGAEPPKATKRVELSDADRDALGKEFEQRWLDEQIPALGGLTPREAALDPIGRYDLERLLDSFEGQSNVMNIARLREVLDL